MMLHHTTGLRIRHRALGLLAFAVLLLLHLRLLLHLLLWLLQLLLLRYNLLLLLLHLQVPPVGASLFLFLFQYLIVEPLAIVLHSELCIVVNGDSYCPVTIELVLWIVELEDIRMPQRIFGGDALAGIEIKTET